MQIVCKYEHFKPYTGRDFTQAIAIPVRNKMANRHSIFTQIFVNLDGVILTASVTTLARSVQTGQMRYQNVEKQTPFLLM